MGPDAAEPSRPTSHSAGRVSFATLVATTAYTVLIAWIALIAVEADPLGDVPKGVPTGMVTVLWVGASLAIGIVARRWALLALPAAVTALGLIYATLETNGYDLPGYVENEVWAASLLLAFALEALLLAAGIAIGQRRRRP